MSADPGASSAAGRDSTGSSISSTRSTTGGGSSTRSSNLRSADFSYNSITHINDLSRHSNLQELLLAGNQIWRVGRGLEPCSKLRKLDLSSNRISSCQGLQGRVTGLLSMYVRGCVAGQKLSCWLYTSRLGWHQGASPAAQLCCCCCRWQLFQPWQCRTHSTAGSLWTMSLFV